MAAKIIGMTYDVNPFDPPILGAEAAGIPAPGRRREHDDSGADHRGFTGASALDTAPGQPGQRRGGGAGGAHRQWGPPTPLVPPTGARPLRDLLGQPDRRPRGRQD